MTNKTDEQIIADAPEGATHVEIFTQIEQKPYYYRREFKGWCGKFIYDWWDNSNDMWLNSTIPTGDFRSLADIYFLIAKNKRIAELKELNNTLYKLMVSGEKRGIAKATEDFESKQAKRDLEQKLEAVNYIIGHDSTKCKSKKSVDCNAIHLADLHNYAFYLEQQLREQAKGGKK